METPFAATGNHAHIHLTLFNAFLTYRGIVQTRFLINKWSQMIGLLMSDDCLKAFTESFKILDTTLDLATLVSPL